MILIPPKLKSVSKLPLLSLIIRSFHRLERLHSTSKSLGQHQVLALKDALHSLKPIKYRQILTIPEEKTIVLWVKRLALTGFSVSPVLLREMAQEVLENRETHASQRYMIPTGNHVIGHVWLYRFLNRHQSL